METVRLHAPDPEKRAVTRALRTALISSVALAAVLLSLLAVASGNNELLQRHYGLLLWLNAGIAAALAILAVEMARRLFVRYRRGQFGTRLMARLALSFILMTAVPVMLIYTVAVQFLGRSIESWFDVPMERALDSGLALGRATLDSLLTDLSTKSRRAADELAREPDDGWPDKLNDLRDQYGIQEALIVSASGRILATSGSRFSGLVPDLPGAPALRQARLARHYAAVEAVEDPLSRHPVEGQPSGLPQVPSARARSPDMKSPEVPPLDVRSPGSRPSEPDADPAGSAALESDEDMPTSDDVASVGQDHADGDTDPGERKPLPAETGDGTDETVPHYTLKLRSLTTIPASRAGEDVRFLQFVHPVPAALANNAEAVQGGFRDYQQLSLSRVGLKRIFKVTLTVTVLLTIFSAIAAAFLLAGWLTGPLSMLAAATRAVAEGDFRPVKDYQGRDELGLLTQSFNAMTRQLHDARDQVERNRVELELANARLASVLSNLTAGVLVLDADLRVTMANAGAEKILGESAQRLAGGHLLNMTNLQPLVDVVREAFDMAGSEGPRTWQQQVVLDAPDSDNDKHGNGKVVLLHGVILPNVHHDRLLVIDDITDVVSAQRAIAWSEVARRLAHEIKNPLTPIQLAAERMALKLADKLPVPERDLLTRNTRTIVNQVGALKVMVDEFRDYARLPSANPVPLDLNELITEILALYQYTDPGRRLHAHLAPGLPAILGDPGQLRQVIHNLLKNASEATEKQAERIVEIFTETVHGTRGQVVAVRMLVRDNGPGFAPTMLPRIFEPYVSNKPKGTGLGLAIVRKIIQDHGGRIEVGNRPEPFAIPEMAPSGGGVSLFNAADASPSDTAATSPPRSGQSSGSPDFGRLSSAMGVGSTQKGTTNASQDIDLPTPDGAATGAWINVLFAKLAKRDENFITPATKL